MPSVVEKRRRSFQRRFRPSALGKVYGAIAFILDHPEAIESYLNAQEALWEKLREEHPMPEHVLELLERARGEITQRSA